MQPIVNRRDNRIIKPSIFFTARSFDSLFCLFTMHCNIFRSDTIPQKIAVVKNTSIKK